MHSSPLLVDCGLEARCRPAERPASVFGLIGFVAAEQHDTARFGHAEHVVPQFGIGGSHVGRHDRVQVAAPHRRQVAYADARMARKMGDPCDETVCHGGPLGLEQIERLACVGGVGTHQRRSGDQRGQQPERESADPEERRVAEQSVVRRQPADSVEILLMSEQGGVGVHHPLGHAGRTRRVDDRQRIRAVDVVSPSPRGAPRRRCLRVRCRSAHGEGEEGRCCRCRRVARESRCRGRTPWREGSRRHCGRVAGATLSPWRTS